MDKRGRPKVLTDRELCNLKRALDTDGFSSVASLKEMVNNTRNHPSDQRAREGTSVRLRCLQGRLELGFSLQGEAAKKPFLSAKNVAKRLVWATAHRGWMALRDGWDAIPALFFKSLVESMPCRVGGVIAAAQRI